MCDAFKNLLVIKLDKVSFKELFYIKIWLFH
jgi:hypothetical protein